VAMVDFMAFLSRFLYVSLIYFLHKKTT